MNARRWAFALLLMAVSGCAAVPATAPPADRDWFVFLETGKKTPDDKARVAEMQRGHIENFKRLFAEKKLFAAGPLRDPSGVKRGIVVVKAPDLATLTSYFRPDEYVREGYMTLNATPAAVLKPLATEGIDPNAIEEVRIVLVARDARVDGVRFQRAQEEGKVGAGYTLESGAWSHVLFSREKDEVKLRDSIGLAGVARVEVWSQWLGKGVVR